MLREIKVDLHIHSCLSPCGSLEMSPQRIVRQAKIKGMDVIGICDHNSAENVVAVKKAAEKEGLTVIGGIEVTSREEIHILALFDENKDLFELQNIIYENLPGRNDEKVFGRQVVANEEDEVLGFNSRLLIGATELSIEYIVDTIHSLNGMAIASHIDKESFSIIGQIGFIPDELALDALEVSPFSSIQGVREKFPETVNYSLVSFSDAHYLEDIGCSSTSFSMGVGSVEEIKKALKL